MKSLVLIVMAIVLMTSIGASPVKRDVKRTFIDSLLSMKREPPPPPRKSNRIVTEGIMIQRIDHFDADNLETIQQRFLSNYEHYNVAVGGPLFIMVGGEYPVREEWLQGGHMFDLAAEHGAAMFYIEQRFFGRSFPSNRTANMDTLQYLTVEQALYDTAYFIEQIRYLLPHFNDAQVILVGASFGGSLVTWYQKTYYELIDGGWASSAPVYAVADFYESVEVTGAVLRYFGGQACYDRVRDGFAELANLFDAGDYAEIRDSINVCDSANIESERGRLHLMEVLSTEFMAVAVIGGDDVFDIECDIIERAESNLAAIRDLNAYLFGNECIDFDYEAYVELLSQEVWIDENNLRPRLFTYQLCNELGWYPSSTSPHQPFGSTLPIEQMYDLCLDVYGLTREEVDTGIAATNERFGGVAPSVQNLITTQGRNDPYRPAGIQEDISPTATVHIIDGVGHSADFYSESDLDSEALFEAKRLVADTIRDFLASDRRQKV